MRNDVADELETREEYEDNTATGIEVEDLGEPFEEIDRPWNPESIRVSTKTFSLRNILDLMDEASLDLAPDFQRLQVWNIRQKAQLIESLLLQIPLPAFYFAEDVDGTMRVVDGLQRLSTVHDFVRGGADHKGGFNLRQLEYIANVEGNRFVDLPAQWQRRIFNTQIVVHVIDPATPPPVKYDIFRRINTGGTPLNAQEIRHCMSKARSRSFLKRCAESPPFLDFTGGAFSRQKRMLDREVVLRYVAFRLLQRPSDYQRFGGMEDLLWRTTERLDDPKDIPDDYLGQLSEDLFTALANSGIVFGRHAFRKWPLASDKFNPFNRALFETWTYELTDVPHDLVQTCANEIQLAARTRMTEDPEYINAITTSTADVRRVAYRFAVAHQIVTSILP